MTSGGTFARLRARINAIRFTSIGSGKDTLFKVLFKKRESCAIALKASIVIERFALGDVTFQSEITLL